MENGREDIHTCPSFNSYSSDRLAEIAVKIAAEKSGDGTEDFEFSLIREESEFSADEFVYSGQLGPIYPVFNRDLLFTDAEGEAAAAGDERIESSIQVPLSKLFLTDRDGDNHEGDNPPSCSSSEADELENIPEGSYCVWRPKLANLPSPIRCNKSKSTGSASKRWKFRDLLRRSNSDGKESLVFLTPRNREEKTLITEIPRKLKGKGGGGSGAGTSSAVVARSAHEALYVRNRAMSEVYRKKSYLPYRQDLVGFFVNVNVLGKGFPHL